MNGIRNLNVWWEPTIPLRFVERDGQRILQQLWTRMGARSGLSPAPTGDWEWHDVPLQAEDKPVVHTDWTAHETIEESKLIDDLKLMRNVQGEH